MKIKTKKVPQPYTLSEIANHFGLNQKRLELKLASLAGDGELHKHDIKKTKNGNYKLSSFAVDVLILDDDETPKTLRKLADLAEKEEHSQSKEYDHSTLLCHNKLLLLRMKSDQLKTRIEGNEKIITEHNKTLDDLVHFVDPPTSLSN